MDIDKIIDLAEIPKTILEGAQSFLNRLLGPTIDETGQLLADKIRYRRLKNQIKIAEDASKLVAESGLTPKTVSLQTLQPLVEKASLEEDSTMQKMWSTLLANAATAKSRDGLHRLCVEVLAGITPKEAVILNHIYGEYERKRPELLMRIHKWNPALGEIHGGSIFFRPSELFRVAEVTADADGDFLLDNLLRLNILKWGIPEVEDGQTVRPNFVELTELGLAVLKECIKGPAA